MKYLITIVIVLWVLFFIFESELALNSLISMLSTLLIVLLCRKWEIENLESKENPTKIYNNVPR